MSRRSLDGGDVGTIEDRIVSSVDSSDDYGGEVVSGASMITSRSAGLGSMVDSFRRSSEDMYDRLVSNVGVDSISGVDIAVGGLSSSISTSRYMVGMCGSDDASRYKLCGGGSVGWLDCSDGFGLSISGKIGSLEGKSVGKSVKKPVRSSVVASSGKSLPSGKVVKGSVSKLVVGESDSRKRGWKYFRKNGRKSIRKRASKLSNKRLDSSISNRSSNMQVITRKYVGRDGVKFDSSSSVLNEGTLHAHISGSLIKLHPVIVGWGVYMSDSNEKMSGVIQLPDNVRKDLSSSYLEVIGKFASVIKAVKYAIDNKFGQVEIYHDYKGVHGLLNGTLEIKNKYGYLYVEKMRELSGSILTRFHKVVKENMRLNVAKKLSARASIDSIKKQ